jgi:hypothetical protein
MERGTRNPGLQQLSEREQELRQKFRIGAVNIVNDDYYPPAKKGPRQGIYIGFGEFQKTGHQSANQLSTINAFYE